MKKYFIILLTIIALVGSIGGYFYIKSTMISKEVDVFTALPRMPYNIVRINNANAMSQALLYNNNYWQDMSTLSSFAEMNQLITHIDSIKYTNESIQKALDNRTFYMASFMKEDKSSTHLWYGQMAKEEWDKFNPIIAKQVSSNYCFAYQDGIFLIGSDQQIVNESLAQIKTKKSIMSENPDFQRIVETAGKRAVFNWIFNIEVIGEQYFDQLTEQGRNMLNELKFYADWCCIDGVIESDKLIFNGFANKKGHYHYTSTIEQQETGHNTLVERMPISTYYYKHLFINNLDLYNQQLDLYSEQHNLPPTASGVEKLETAAGESPIVFFQNFFGGEIAYGCTPEGEFVLVKLIDAEQASQSLQHLVEEMAEQVNTTTQNGLSFYQFNNNGFAGCVFGRNYTLPEEHISILGNKLIIASNQKLAHHITTIDANTQTLPCSSNYQEANRMLLSKSNLSLYIDIPFIVQNANQFVTGNLYQEIEQTKTIWENFSVFCMQTENDLSGNTFNHLFVQYNKLLTSEDNTVLASNTTAENIPSETTVQQIPEATPVEQPAESETNELTDIKEIVRTRTISNQKPLCTATLDYPAAIAPQLVKNHKTGEHEIVIQDTHNQLYLINSSGKILWKKSLSDRIVGNISQVDLFKNNKLQLAFATKNQLIVMDRNGNMVSGFPKSFSKSTVCGLTTCDYDKNRDYRFFIPHSDGTITLLKSDGSSPSDWQFAGSKGLQNEIQYFNQKGKDFLVTFDKDQCYFLNRKGQERILSNNSIKKATHGSFYEDVLGSKNRFICTSPQGNILYVYNNEVKEASIKKYSENHLFTLFKGNYGNYYIYLDQQGLDVYDRDLNIYMRDSEIKGGTNPTLLMHKSIMAAYENEQQCWIIYNLVGQRQAYQIFTSDTPLAYFGTFKPYSSPCLVVTEGKELKWYKINEK